MLHLSKNKAGKLFVATLASNHLQLSCSQPKGLASRKGAIKNIRAQLRTFGSESTLVQDNTNGTPVVLRVHQDRIEKTLISTSKPYVPAHTRRVARKKTAPVKRKPVAKRK